MQKILKFIRNIIVFTLWTLFFTYFFKTLIYTFWSFDILSAHSWQTLLSFWNHGGVFKTTSDLLLLISLILFPPVYVVGFIKVKKIKFFNALTSLFGFFFKDNIDEPERVVIKGMKTTQQLIDDVKNELESLKPEKSKESGSIRSAILQKIDEGVKK